MQVAGDEAVNEALDIAELHHNLELSRAEELLKGHGGGAAQRQLHAQTAWVRALITEEREHTKEAQKRISVGIKALQKPSQRNFWKKVDLPPREKVQQWLWHRMHLADLYLLDSFLKFRIPSYVKAVLSFRRAWKCFDVCLQHLSLALPAAGPNGEEPELSLLTEMLISNINFGVGMFHFLVSVVPRNLLWLVEGIGFKADRRLAMEELTIASRYLGTRTITAKLVLIALQSFFLSNEAAAMTIYEAAMEAHPNSPALQYFGGYLSRKCGRLDESEALFVQCAAGARDTPQLGTLVVYERGYIRYLYHDWKGAMVLFEQFLKESKTSGYKAFCHYQLAVCRVMTGDLKGSLKAMKEIPKLARNNYAYDQVALRRAKYLLDKKSGMSSFTRAVLHAELLHERRAYDETMAALDDAEKEAKSDDERLVILSLRGEVHKEQKAYASAAALFEQVVGTKSLSGVFSYALPMAQVGLAEIRLMNRDVEGAEALLKPARKASGYDYENWAQLRIRRIVDSIAEMHGEAEAPEQVGPFGPPSGDLNGIFDQDDEDEDEDEDGGEDGVEDDEDAAMDVAGMDVAAVET